MCCNVNDALSYDNTKASWQMQLDYFSDVFRVYRAPFSAPTAYAAVLGIDAAGSLFITGPVGQKSTGTTWANPSDRRLKEDIVDYPSGLAAVVQLLPRTFVYNGLGGSTAGARGCGFIADEVATAMPDMLGAYQFTREGAADTGTDYATVDQSHLILALVNAVKELAGRVAALEGTA